MRELLIVGVDPGTTAGYAVLDTAGKVLRTRSSKQLELNTIVEEVVSFGSVLAIGTDKQKCPQLIEKIAAMTGARVITPSYDLPVAEKDGMAQGFTGSQHEKDALAAAMYAHKELEPLMQRIGKVLQQEGKPEFFREVTKTVVMTGKNIRDALRMAQEEEKPAEEKTEAVAATAEKAYAAQKSETTEAKQLKRAEKENEILRNYASKLLGRIKAMRKEQRRLAKSARQHSKAAAEKRHAERERNGSGAEARLRSIIGEKDRQAAGLRSELRQMEKILASGDATVKKLKTLGLEELQQKSRMLGIGENDIVLVENPDSFSEKALEHMRERSITILTRKRISPAVARVLHDAELTTMPAEGIIIMEAENFAAADRQRLAEMRKMSAGTKLFGIIEGYKEERKMKLIEND
ncbi:DUF460 domain-containing protein [Candidatus Woesearchaeota archaeon]|nr:DUF460 domain-containing protein [Candidatus Woesearchaeota archaeon]